MLPMVCQYLQSNQTLRNQILSDLRLDDLENIGYITEQYLTDFFELLKMLPEKILWKVIYNNEGYENLLQYALNIQKHQALVIDLIKPKSKQFIYKIFGDDLILQASVNPPIIFKEILSMLNGFTPESQFEIIRRSESFPISNIFENTASFLDFISNMIPVHHLGLLASFDWKEIFQQNYCKPFLEWFATKPNEYKLTFLNKNALAKAVYSKDHTMIANVIAVIQTLDIKDQTQLFRGFDEATEIHQFTARHQSFIQQIRSFMPENNKKRTFGLFQPSDSSSASKQSRPKH